MVGEIADQEVKVEILIIGSEAAGARAAIEACERGADVLVVTKGLLGKGGDTIVAGQGIQGGAGMGDPRDNVDIHMEDMVGNRMKLDVFQECIILLTVLGKL